MIFPWAIILSLKTNYSKLNDENFILKYSSLIQNIKKDKNFLTLIYFPLSMIRKQIFIATQMFLLEIPKVQAFLNAIVTGLVLLYLILKLPFSKKLINISFIIGEFCVFLVFCLSITFTYTDENESVNFIEDFCIYTIYTCAGLQLAVSFLSTFIKLKKLLTKFLHLRSKIVIHPHMTIMTRNRPIRFSRFN